MADPVVSDLERRVAALEAANARLMELIGQCAVTAHGAVVSLIVLETQLGRLTRHQGLPEHDPAIISQVYAEALELEKMMPGEKPRER